MEQMMMWFPLVGPQKRIYADLVRQLKARTQEDMSAWEIHPKEIRELAGHVSQILTEYLGWSEDAIFLPDDPADIPFWDKTGDLAGVEAMVAVEKALGVEMGDDFWEKLSQMTFSQVIQKMSDRRADRDRDPPRCAPSLTPLRADRACGGSAGAPPHAGWTEGLVSELRGVDRAAPGEYSGDESGREPGRADQGNGRHGGTGNPPPLPKGGVSETLRPTWPAPKSYSTR